MAEETKPAPKPAAPPQPKQTVAEKARADIAKGKHGFDPMRPFRYASAFIKGTVHDTLNGLAQWGRRGLKWGLIAGVVAAIGLPALAITGVGVPLAILSMIESAGVIGTIFGTTAVGFLGGAALGSTHGLLTGGTRAMNREHRRDKYAEDLVQRKVIRDKAPPSRADYRAQARAREARSDFMTAYALDREAENARDANTYWSDREHRTNGSGMSRW